MPKALHVCITALDVLKKSLFVNTFQPPAHILVFQCLIQKWLMFLTQTVNVYNYLYQIACQVLIAMVLGIITKTIHHLQSRL